MDTKDLDPVVLRSLITQVLFNVNWDQLPKSERVILGKVEELMEQGQMHSSIQLFRRYLADKRIDDPAGGIAGTPFQTALENLSRILTADKELQNENPPTETP